MVHGTWTELWCVFGEVSRDRLHIAEETRVGFEYVVGLCSVLCLQ